MFFVGECSGKIDEDDVDLSELTNQELMILEALLSRSMANLRQEKYFKRKGTQW